VNDRHPRAPLPWRLGDDDEPFRRDRIIVDAEGEPVVKTDGGIYPPCLADAEMIIHRVNGWGALRAALEGLRYPPEPGQPDRFCDHAAEPCDRCEAARVALGVEPR
jgi:hypothetical protein